MIDIIITTITITITIIINIIIQRQAPVGSEGLGTRWAKYPFSRCRIVAAWGLSLPPAARKLSSSLPCRLPQGGRSCIILYYVMAYYNILYIAWCPWYNITYTSFPLLPTGPHRAEGATLADRLATSRDYKHSGPSPDIKGRKMALRMQLPSWAHGQNNSISSIDCTGHNVLDDALISFKKPSSGLRRQRPR